MLQRIKRRLAAPLFVLCLGGAVLIPAHPASASTPAWRGIGPSSGGYQRALALDPADPNVIYVGLDQHRVYKTVDGGASWAATGEIEGRFGDIVVDLDVHPGQRSTIHALLTTGLATSTDAGGSWTVHPVPEIPAWSMSVPPTAPGTVYLGTGSGAYRTVDGGVTWELLNNGMPANHVLSIAVDGSSPGTIYAGTAGGVFKSIDGGTTWQLANTGMGSAAITALAVSPADPRRLLAAYAGGVFRTTDGAASWKELNTGLPEKPWIDDLVADPVDPSRAYLASSRGVFRLGEGSEWELYTSGLRGGVTSIAIAGSSPSTLYAATPAGRGGVHRSADAGQTWTALPTTGLPGDTWLGAVAPASDGKTIYAGTVGNHVNIYVSRNAGLTWAPADEGLPPYVHARDIAVHPTDPGVAYVVVDSYIGDWVTGPGTTASVFKTTDTGTTWKPLGRLRDQERMWAVAIDPLQPQTVYAGGENSLFKSTNGGTTWTQLNNTTNGLPFTGMMAIAIDPVDSRNVYVGSSSFGVFKSTDRGQTWMLHSAGLTNTWVLSIAIDPSTPSVLYVGTRSFYRLGSGVDGGVFKTTTGGLAWLPMNSGLSDLNVGALLVDPARPSTVYAGLSDQDIYGDFSKGNGVFRSTDGAQSWTGVSDGLESPLVTDLAAMGGTILAASYGGGVHALAGQAT